MTASPNVTNDLTGHEIYVTLPASHKKRRAPTWYRHQVCASFYIGKGLLEGKPSTVLWLLLSMFASRIYQQYQDFSWIRPRRETLGSPKLAGSTSTPVEGSSNKTTSARQATQEPQASKPCLQLCHCGQLAFVATREVFTELLLMGLSRKTSPQTACV